MTTLSVPSSYATIEAAITAASDGDTIQVADGTYGTSTVTTLSINKSVTIIGNNKDKSYDSTRNNETTLLL